jgi:O-antigen ligase
MALLNPPSLRGHGAKVAQSLPAARDWADTLDGTARGVLLAAAVILPPAVGKSLHDPFEFPKYLLLNLVAVALVGLQLAAHALRPQPLRLEIPRDWLSLSVLGLLLSAALSTLGSISPATSLDWGHHSYVGLRTYLSGAVIFFSTRNLFRTDERKRLCLTALVFGGVVPALYGLIQVGGLDPFEWELASHFAGQRRAFGTLGHPNHLAALLVVLLPLALDRQVVRGRFYLAIGVAILFAVAILFTYSRIAWAAAGVVALLRIGAVRQRISKRTVLLGGGTLAVLVALLISSNGLQDRFATLSGVGNRAELWSASVKIWGDYPLTGCGLNAFGSAFGPHRSAAHEAAEWAQTPANAHNEFLHLLATQGTLGGAAGLVLIVGAVLTLRSWPESGAIGMSLLAAVIILSTGFLVVPLLAILGVLLGLLPTPTPRPERESHGSRGFAVALALGFAAVVPFAIDSQLRDFAASRRCAAALDLPDEERDQAKSMVSEACERRPNSAVYWTLKASLLTGRLGSDPSRAAEWLIEAREAMRRVTELQPRDGQSWAGYGRLLALGVPGLKPEEESATMAFAEAMKWEPNDPRLWAELAARALGRNDLAGARARVEHALGVSPDFARATALLSLIEWRSGDRLGAIRRIERAFLQNWHNDREAFRNWYGDYGWMTFELELYERTISIGERLAQDWPESPVGPLLIANGCEKRKQFERAKANYLSVLELDPANQSARLGLQRVKKVP